MPRQGYANPHLEVEHHWTEVGNTQYTKAICRSREQQQMIRSDGDGDGDERSAFDDNCRFGNVIRVSNGACIVGCISTNYQRRSRNKTA